MGWTQDDLNRRNREVFGIGASAQPLVSDVPLAADLMPEWMFEGEATKFLEEDGWRALRTDPVSDRGKGKGFGEIGMADHLYIRYHSDAESLRRNHHQPGTLATLCCVMWVEYKSAKGKPKKDQLLWHAKERARGALTLIAGVDFPASLTGFQEWYRKSGLMRRTKWW